MYSIKPKIFSNKEPYFNLTGNDLRTKFSILERRNEYFATSAKGNSELISFLDQLSYLNNKIERDGYYWWTIKPSKVITTLNAVMVEFE